jgi:hypothetical protein
MDTVVEPGSKGGLQEGALELEAPAPAGVVGDDDNVAI